MDFALAALSDLTAILARTSGVPEATVFAYGRFAREAGLISQRGRGPGAARMEARDAANLLLALGGTATTREAPSAIRHFGGLRPKAIEVSPLKTDARHLLTKVGLSPSMLGQPLDETLSILLQAFGTRSLLRAVAEGHVGVDVAFNRTLRQVRLRLADAEGGTLQMEFGTEPSTNARVRDFTVLAHVSDVSLMGLGATLADLPAPPLAIRSATDFKAYYAKVQAHPDGAKQ